MMSDQYKGINLSHSFRSQTNSYHDQQSSCMELNKASFVDSFQPIPEELSDLTYTTSFPALDSRSESPSPPPPWAELPLSQVRHGHHQILIR